MCASVCICLHLQAAVADCHLLGHSEKDLTVFVLKYWKIKELTNNMSCDVLAPLKEFVLPNQGCYC